MSNQLPKGWKEDIISNLSIEVSSGGTPNRSISDYYKGNIPWVKTGEVQDCVIYNTEEHISELALKNSAAKIFPKGTLLVAMYGATASKLALLSIEAATNQACCGIQIDKEKTYSKYLYYFLLHEREALISLTSGAGQQNLNVGKIKNYKITYPEDKNEQKYIVDTLDTVAEAIRLRKDTIEKTKELIPAIFSDMFGDPIKNEKGFKVSSLGNENICRLQYGYTGTAISDGDIRYIRITDIDKDGYISNANIAYLNYDSSMSDCVLKKKDLVVARTGATYAKTLLYKEESEAVFASFLIKIIFEANAIIPEFYWAYTQTQSYWHQANSLVSGVAQPQFNGGALKQIKILLPPLSLQEEFARKVEEINQYLEVQKAELSYFEELFQSLLQDAFTGKLTWNFQRGEKK